jgi:magnesium chelatase family protein
MFASVTSSVLRGAFGSPVTVEVHIGKGLPGFTVVGQPDEACRESRDRVRAAILSSGFEWPNRRITVNLAGAGEKKGGAGLDLAIALGVLVASEVIPPAALENRAFIGELGLDGALRPTAGIAPLAHSLRGMCVVVPEACHSEAHLAAPHGAVCTTSLAHLVDILRGNGEWSRPAPPPPAPPSPVPDMGDVQGHAEARFALEVAAAGRHHVLMVGPPGAGKSMLASRLPGLLPPLSEEEALEVALVRGAAGLSVEVPPSRVPPYRAPHHSSSLVSLVGGGSPVVRPGEISLAHNGVLFLDEMSEFAPSALDALRQPLEDKEVRIGRARAAVTLPADFLMVAATNPCPCGDERGTECSCTPQNRHRWLRRISAPLLDRFDVRVWVPRPTAVTMLATPSGESSAIVSARVARARALAISRQGCTNAAIPPGRLDEVSPLTSAARSEFARALDKGTLTARGYHRARRLARTIADLHDGSDAVDAHHAMAALAMRRSVSSAGVGT